MLTGVESQGVGDFLEVGADRGAVESVCGDLVFGYGGECLTVLRLRGALLEITK